MTLVSLDEKHWYLFNFSYLQGFQIRTIFGDLWLVIGDILQKSGPPYDHFLPALF